VRIFFTDIKLIGSIMTEQHLYGLPRTWWRIRNLIRPNTPADLVNWQLTATRPHEPWCNDINEHPGCDGGEYCCAILD